MWTINLVDNRSITQGVLVVLHADVQPSLHGYVPWTHLALCGRTKKPTLDVPEEDVCDGFEGDCQSINYCFFRFHHSTPNGASLDRIITWLSR